MNRRSLKATVCALVLLGSVGCAGGGARLVKCDQDGGIVAIPRNTNCWPDYYRDKAKVLMAQTCPQGYTIVKQEEVVVGQTSRTFSNTDTEAPPAMTFGSEKSTANKDRETRSGAGVTVPMGETRSRTTQTTTHEDVTEFRIWFRPLVAPTTSAVPPGAPTPVAPASR